MFADSRSDFSKRGLVWWHNHKLASIEQWLPSDGSASFPNYGLGFGQWSTPHGVAIGHLGQEFGYVSVAYYFPERETTFVVFSNASSLSEPTHENTMYVFLEKVLPSLLDALFGE